MFPRPTAEPTHASINPNEFEKLPFSSKNDLRNAYPIKFNHLFSDVYYYSIIYTSFQYLAQKSVKIIKYLLKKLTYKMSMFQIVLVKMH